MAGQRSRGGPPRGSWLPGRGRKRPAWASSGRSATECLTRVPCPWQSTRPSNPAWRRNAGAHRHFVYARMWVRVTYAQTPSDRFKRVRTASIHSKGINQLYTPKGCDGVPHQPIGCGDNVHGGAHTLPTGTPQPHTAMSQPAADLLDPRLKAPMGAVPTPKHVKGASPTTAAQCPSNPPDPGGEGQRSLKLKRQQGAKRVCGPFLRSPFFKGHSLARAKQTMAWNKAPIQRCFAQVIIPIKFIATPVCTSPLPNPINTKMAI